MMGFASLYPSCVTAFASFADQALCAFPESRIPAARSSSRSLQGKGDTSAFDKGDISALGQQALFFRISGVDLGYP